jgi:hypothetical protein
MAALNLGRLVFVTTVASVVTIALGMARPAGILWQAAMVKGKHVELQISWSPCIRVVAVLALQTKRARVQGRFGMASGAVLRGIQEDLFKMAGFTLDFRMATFQWKILPMVEA